MYVISLPGVTALIIFVIWFYTSCPSISTYNKHVIVWLTILKFPDLKRDNYNVVLNPAT